MGIETLISFGLLQISLCALVIVTAAFLFTRISRLEEGQKHLEEGQRHLSTRISGLEEGLKEIRDLLLKKS